MNAQKEEHKAGYVNFSNLQDITDQGFGILNESSLKVIIDSLLGGVFNAGVEFLAAPLKKLRIVQ